MSPNHLINEKRQMTESEKVKESMGSGKFRLSGNSR
jgi:hypothetical protein